MNRRALLLLAAIFAALPPAARAHDLTCERALGLAAPAPGGGALLDYRGMPLLLAPPGPVLDVDTYPALLAVRTRLADVAPVPSTLTGVEDALVAAAGGSARRHGPSFSPGFTVGVGAPAEQVVVVPIASYQACLALGGEPAGAPACRADGAAESRFVVRFDEGQAECRARLRCLAGGAVPPAWRGARQFGSDRQDQVADAALDGAGRLHLVGSSYYANALGTVAQFVVTFDPSGRQEPGARNPFLDDTSLTAVAPRAGGGAVYGGWSPAGGALLRATAADGRTVWTRTPPFGFVKGVVTGPGGAVTAVGGRGGPAGDDAVVARLDAGGNLAWYTELGTPANDAPAAVALDRAGNVYVAGHAWTSSGGVLRSDAWAAKLDPGGAILWRRSLAVGGPAAWTGGLAVGDDGLVAVAGWSDTSVGQRGWVVALDADGNARWRWDAPAATLSNLAAVAVDGGSVWAAGYGALGAQVARLGADGALRWVRSYTLQGSPVRLLADRAGGAIVVGVTSGDLAGPSAGGLDVFAIRLDADGNP